jgi:hypothetical protein
MGPPLINREKCYKTQVILQLNQYNIGHGGPELTFIKVKERR